MDDKENQPLTTSTTAREGGQPKASGSAAEKKRPSLFTALFTLSGHHQSVVVTALFSIGLLLASLLFALGTQLEALSPEAVKGIPVLVAEQPQQQEGLSSQAVISKVAPSVVSLDVYPEDGLTPMSSGSGIILSANGYLATNAHVVKDGHRIRAVLYNGKGYTAQLVGVDVASDLAVLKIDASGLQPASFALSEEAALGQRVYVIGNAAGSLPGSITQGILSGVERDMPLATVNGGVMRLKLLQTDAAINPGCSGGAMANGDGQVLGIIIGKLENENVENIGFAIPSATALPILQKLMEEGKLPIAAMLGTVVVALNETTGPPLGLPSQGLYISQLLPESSLREVGVEAGDVIIKADGKPLVESADLFEVLSAYQPGDQLELTIYFHRKGEVRTVTATLYQPLDEDA